MSEQPKRITRFEVMDASGHMVAAFYSVLMAADFIGQRDGYKIRHVDGWMNYVDATFQVIAVLEEFEYKAATDAPDPNTPFNPLDLFGHLKS